MCSHGLIYLYNLKSCDFALCSENFHIRCSFFILGYGVHDLNGYNTTGFMQGHMISRNGIRYSTARAFLRPARNRQNLHILLNTTASRVLFKPNTKTVAGVELLDKNNRTLTVAVRKEVVVSGGAIDSPKVLLLSGIGPAKELKQVNT